MNKIYKVIWSHARNCYVVVAEIAKNHGKNNVRSIMERLASHALQMTRAQWVAPVLTAGIFLQAATGFASTITDAGGNSLAGSGNVHNLYVQKVLDNNNIGLNKFKEYKISTGHIANMYFNEKNGSVYVNNLVNLVKENRIDIQGTVNAIKNGRIDGNLYFISPNGMTVGKTGVINAGRFGAFVPDTSYWDELWKYEPNVVNNFSDFEKYGRRDKDGNYNDTRLVFPEGKNIIIEGQINTRSGIVLGAREVLVNKGAVLQGNREIDFTGLVNAKNESGAVVTQANLTGVGMTAASDDKSGDIILRAESAHAFENGMSSVIIYESLTEKRVEANVEVGGAIVTDSSTDMSAEARTIFTNTAYGGGGFVSDLTLTFLSDVGINMNASWVDKTNKATVTLTKDGSIKAGGDVNLQADAVVDIHLKSDLAKKKTEGTSTAVPVIAVGVVKLANEALVDVKGSLLSDGNMKLSANADTTADMTAQAFQIIKDNDPANSIYTGVAILTGNGLADVNVDTGTAITAGGDFTAEARGTSRTAVEASAKGKDETFASTAVAVSDYDSAANVNLGRSVTAKSVTGQAVNDVKALAILADNSNGEGEETYVAFEAQGGDGLTEKLADKLKNKLRITGFQNGGCLLPAEEFLTSLQDYVTAGAAVAVVDHSNTANLTVAPGAELKATGTAADGGDVVLKAQTVNSTLNQIVTGQSNQKAGGNGGSAVTVAAGVLVSNIENAAAVEVQGDTKNHKGAKLTSQNGNVEITANSETDTDHVITTLHGNNADFRIKDIEDRFDELINQVENMGKDAAKLKNIKTDFQRTWGQLKGGVKDLHVTSSLETALVHNDLVELVLSEWKDYYKVGSNFKALVDALLDYTSPSAYTTHYVRSYVVNRNQGGNTNVDLAASVNVGSLAGKSVVSLGEGATVNAGQNITVDAKSVSDTASITGNGGELLSFSETNGNGIGASVAVQNFTTDAIVLAGKNVVLNAKNGTIATNGSNGNETKSGTVSVAADNDAGQLGLIFSAGKSDKNGFAGSFNIQMGGSNSLVLVDDEAQITAANGVTVNANNDYVMTDVVGGLAIGSSKSNVTAGAGLALNQMEVNSMAVLADNGKGSSTAETDTDTEEFAKKSAEEQNKIKAENTVIAARKLAAARAKVKKMDASFNETEYDLTATLGNKTEGKAKGFVTGRDISVTSASGGKVNAVALEGADVSESHSVMDGINKATKIGSAAKEQTRTAIKNVADWPAAKFVSLFTKDGRENFKTKKSFNFGEYNPVTSDEQPSNSAFNGEAAASFAWNNLDTQTASVVDNMSLNLRKQNASEADGKLVTAATDKLFTGAWAGSGSLMWFSGTDQGASNNNANKGALGTAIAVNHLDQKVNSLIINSDITQAGTVQNTAIKSGSEVAAGLGIAVVKDSGGSAADASVAFGLSLNMADNDIHAMMIDSNASYEKTKDGVSYTGTTGMENSAYDGDIQVAGGVTASWLSNGGSGIAAGITAAASDLKNDIQSGILGGSYTGIGDLSVKSESSLTQVNVGIGLGVAQAGGSFSIGGAGTVALNELENTSRAYIADTDRVQASKDVTVLARDISATEDNPYKEYLKEREVDSTGLSYLGDASKDAVGKEAGNTIVNVAAEVAESKGISAGAAVSVNQVTNTISADITGNKQLEAARVNGEADVHTNIVSLAAGASVSESSFGGAASVSWNDLQQDNIVSVTGNRNGVNTAGGIKADSVKGTARNTSHIVNVTGEFAGGKNSVGLSAAVNRMDDTSGIYFAKNRIGARDASTGTAVSLDAANDAHALAIAVGADANYKDDGLVAAYGSFVANRGHNDTVAVIGEDKDGNAASGSERDVIADAASVDVKVTDKNSKTAAAGSAELAIKNTKMALGIGVALTESDEGSESGNGRETLRAEVNNADITTVGKGDSVPAISVGTADKSEATTVAVGIGITKSSVVGAQGIGADANIYKDNTAGIRDTTVDKSGGSKKALVSVSADTASTLKTGAAALELSGKQSFLTGIVAVGTNRIKDTTNAAVTYTNKQAATSMNLGNLDINAASNSSITSVAAGASGTWNGTAALSGSGSYNYIENNASAKIKKADINSTGNVGVVAQSDEAVSNYAGVVEVAATGEGVAAAIGVTASKNEISGSTEALIENSRVTAKGSDSNKIKTAGKLKIDDNYLIDGAVTKNTWQSGRLQEGRKEEEKTGVVVDASATHAIASVMANGGVAVSKSGGVSVAGVVNLNKIGGSTGAKILDSAVNNADSRSDVTVRAADYTNVAEFSGAAAVGIGNGAGIAAGFTGSTNKIDRMTLAGVSTSSAKWNSDTKQYETNDTGKNKNTVYAKDFAVTADAKQAMSGFNVAGAIAGGPQAAIETGDNVNTNKMESVTIAAVANTTLDFTAKGQVKASHEERIYNINVDTGAAIAPSEEGVAASLNVGVGVVSEDSVVGADVQNSILKAHEKSNGDTSKTEFSIGAFNSTTVKTTLVSAGVAIGAFSGGVASSISVNNIDTQVTSQIRGSELKADKISLDTSSDVTVKDAVGTGAGALLVGVGVGVEVNTLNDTVSTIVDNSTLKAADSLSVNTKAERDIDSTVAGVGVGVVGVSVNVLAVTVNDGTGSLEDVQDNESKSETKGTFSQKDTLSSVLENVNSTEGRDLSGDFQGLTDEEKREMQAELQAHADSGDSKAGTGVHTYLRNKSVLEATNGALTVINTELNDADLNGGSGSLGAVAVNVADTVYHLNRLNDIRVDGSTVTGGSVAVKARQGNVTENKEDAIRVRTVQAGLGIVGVGVGYAGLTVKGDTGVTVDKSTISATQGDLALTSDDTVQSKSSMIGASAAIADTTVSVAHNDYEARNTVSAGGSSTLSAKGNLSLQAGRSGRVAAKTVGVGAGGVAVVVNTAKAKDAGISGVEVKGSGNTLSAGTITLNAAAAPEIKAEAGGTDASLIGVAVMVGKGTAESQATVTVEDGNKLLADTVQAQAVIGKSDATMVHAETHSTLVSAASVNPNDATAVTSTTAKVEMGQETYKTEKKEKTKNEQGQEEEKTVTGAFTDLILTTLNNASRKAVLGNTTIGALVSVGIGDAETSGNDESLVEAKGGNGNTPVKLQNLTISAEGNNSAQGYADGDSGSLIDVSGPATVTLDSTTTNTASLSGVWDVSQNASIASNQQVTSKATSKTGAGGVVSVNWAHSQNNVTMNTNTRLQEGAILNAGKSVMLAANKVITGAYDGESWSNHMNIGGVIQVAKDVTSEQVVKADAGVDIGKNARVTTGQGQVFEVYADLDITNKAEGKSGGVGENMWVNSESTVKPTNKITVQEGAALEQKGEYENGSDITLSSTDKIVMDTAAEAYTGGLEGVLVSKAENTITRHNRIEVSGRLYSTHDINLFAGADKDGGDAELDVQSLSESHNNTLLSFKTNPKIVFDLSNNQQVIVNETGSASSVRNINVTADNGSESFKKDVVKVANLLTKKSESVKTVTNMPGDSDISEDNNNFVNVEGLLKTGVQNNVKIDITGASIPVAKDDQGNVIDLKPVNGNLKDLAVSVVNNSGTNTDTIIKKEDIKTGEMDYATQLGEQLAAVEKLIKDYSDGKKDDKSTAAYLGYVQQRQRILDELDKRGLFTEETGKDGEKVKVYITKGFTISYVEIPEVTVSGGNIVVQSDSLYGKGRLEANGAPQIEINNLSNTYLKLDGALVGEEGGEIRFQKQSISSGDAGKTQINKLNKNKKKAEFSELYSDASSAAVSAIRVLNNNESVGTQIKVKDNKGNESSYTAVPDVAVLGNITNNFGDVHIENKQGDIVIGSGDAKQSANINGRNVQLIATQGSISQDYVDGIVNVGGRPQDLNSDETNEVIEDADLIGDAKEIRLDLKENGIDIEKAEAGRIAGDSVYIAAADINVNGLIQSGYSQYAAEIPADALSDENIGKLRNNGSEVTLQGRTMYKINDGNKVVYDKNLGAFKYIIQVYYDPQTKGLLVEDIDTKGGSIYLTGRISSTGNGRILAADGGAEISIVNHTAGNLTTGKILNNEIEGKITVTDLAKDTWTEFTRTRITTINDYTKHLKQNDDLHKYKVESDGTGWFDKDDPYSYTIQDGLRYNWTLGQEKGVTKKYEKVTKTLFWGGVDIGKDENKLGEYENDSTLEEVQTKDGRSLGSGNFIDVIPDTYEDDSGNKLITSTFGAILESNITSTSRTETGHWKESGDWYALWSNPKYYTTWTTKEGSTQAYTFSLKADYPIAMGFLGQENGNILVSNTNPEGGNVNLNGNIKNNTKDATLTVQALGGSIIQQGDTFLTAGRAELEAKLNIRNIHIASMGQRVPTGKKDARGNDTYTTGDGVQLKAVSTGGGNIDVEVVGGSAEGLGLPGNVVIQKLESLGQNISDQSGSVSLKAQGSITQSGSDATVSARLIHLTSENGGIGTSDQAVVVHSAGEAFGYSLASAGVNASAKGDISLTEASGDMRVGSVISQEGNVRLEAKTGRLLDMLPRAENDNNVSEDDLVRHWIDSGLIAGTPEYEGAYITGLKQDAANYKARVEEQFNLFVKKEANNQIREMFTKADGTVYTSADEYLASDKKYQELTDAYNPDKVHYAWTKEQLLYAIRNLIVNKESGVTAETKGKVANVQGKNVTLVAQGIGTHSNKVTVIKTEDIAGGSPTAIANLKLLANADSADVTLKDGNGNTLFFITVDGIQVPKAYDDAGNEVATDGYIDKFIINNLSPLGVYATGVLNVTVDDSDAFIAGRSNDRAGFSPLNVGQIAAGGNDVRLYTQEGISNAMTDLEIAGGSANITAKNLIAYGGTKDIGAKDRYLTVGLSGDLLTAAADGNVYIRNVSADVLRLGSVFAGNTISLDSAAGYAMTVNKDYVLAYLNAGKQLELKTSRDDGIVGEEDNPIRILNNGTIINLEAKEAHVKGMNGLQAEQFAMKLGDIQMKDAFSASSEGDLEAGVSRDEVKDEKGAVVSPAIVGQVKAGGNVKLQADKAITVSGPVGSSAGDISVKAGTDMTLNNAVTAGVLTLADGTYSGGGQIELVSANGWIVQNGGGALSARGVTAVNGNAVTLVNENNRFREFMAKGAETGETDEKGNKVTGINGSVTVKTHAGSNLDAGIASTVYGNVTITNLDNGSLTVTTDITTKKGKNGEEGAVAFEQNGSILINGALSAEGNIDLKAGNDIVIGDKVTTSEHASLAAKHNITETGTGALAAKEVAVEVGNTLNLQGSDNAFPHITVRGITPAGGTAANSIAGDVLIKDSTQTLSLNVASEVKGRAEVENRTGSLSVDSALKADTVTLYAQKQIGQQAEIVTNSLHTIAGTGIDLQNENNRFPKITLQGLMTQTVPEESNISLYPLDAISGSVAIKTHGGKALAVTTRTDRGSELLLVGDDFTVENLEANGGITMDNSVAAFGETEGTGNITLKAEGTIMNGNPLDKVVLFAMNDITLTSAKGLVYNFGGMYANHDITLNAANGIRAGKNTGDVVSAGNDVVLNTTAGTIEVLGTVKTDRGDISATVDQTGDIELHGNVEAGRNVMVATQQGDAVFNGDIVAGDSVLTHVNKGDITVGKFVAAKQGKVTMVTSDGSVTVGEEKGGGGFIRAGSDITIATKKGDATVKTAILSENGSVFVRSDQGNIKIGVVPVATAISAKKNISLHVAEGVITINGKTQTADGDIVMQAKNEKVDKNIVITENGKLISGRDLTLHTYNGGIEVTDDTVARRNLTVIVDNKGDVTFATSVDVQGDISADVKQGNITIGHEIMAGKDISMKTGSGSIHIGNNGPDVRTVYAVGNIDMYVADGVINVYGKTETANGDITMQAKDEYTDQNIVIAQNGKLISGRDLTLHTYNGGIKVTDDTVAKRNLTVKVDNKGDVIFATSVDVKGDISADVKQGNITVGHIITAGKDINMKTGSGTIHIGDNGPTVKTVTAKENVKLETGNGKIEIYGETFTETGDITLKAASNDYIAGTAGHNIIIDDNGRVDAGRDVTLDATNGDIHVTHEITAKRNISAITQKRGDIFLDRDVDTTGNNGDGRVGGSVFLKADIGNIIVGSDSDGRQYKLKAEERIEALTQDGNITVGTAEARYVSLVSRSEEGHVTVDEIHAQASGNDNGTGVEDVKLGGGHVAVGSVINDSNGTVPLIISTTYLAGDRAIKDFRLGDRNENGNYSGGIISASGAVIQQLWTETGLVYMAGNSDLRISKMVVNNKLLVANDAIAVGIFGRSPTHDGERVVYWNNFQAHNPTGMQDRWYNGSYSDSAWMNLDLFGNGDIGSRYGVLIDAQGYRRLYGDSVSMVDTMRIRMEPKSAPSSINFFDRSNLIQIDGDGTSSDEKAEEIIVEEN